MSPTRRAKLQAQYRKDLRAVVNKIFSLWSQPLHDLAWEADLNYNTVSRIKNDETRFPRFLTVQKLAHAVGLEVNLVKTIEVRSRKTA